MQEQSYFQLLSPLIYMLFACGFVFVFCAHRDTKSAGWFAASYTGGAAAMLFDFFRDFMAHQQLTSLFTNILFLITLTLFCIGAFKKVGLEIPKFKLALAMLFASSGFIYFLYIDQHILNRTLWVNLGYGLIMTVALPTFWAKRDSFLDKLLLTVYSLSVAQFFIRPALVVNFAGSELTWESYSTSAFALTLHFTMAVCAVSTAMLLLLSYGLALFQRVTLQSQTDVLTGILNRRGFEESAAQLLDDRAGGGRTIALIMADIDHFKDVNDTYGHAAGDVVIARLGHLFGSAAIKPNIAGRLGGEEFALVLADGRSEVAKSLAEDLRKTFETQTFKFDNEDISFTASFGVASCDVDEGVLEALSRADEALYLAKQSGRNRVMDQADVGVAKLREMGGFTTENTLHLIDKIS